MASKLATERREGVHVQESTAPAEEIGGWVTAILLSLLLLNLGWSIGAANWAEGLDVLSWILLGGVIIGILTARSRFDGLFPVLYGLITGIAWITYWVSTLIPDDFTGQRQVYELFSRWYVWFERAVNGSTSSDNLVFILELAFLGWWLAFLAGWAVFREQRTWRAIVPVGIAMIVNAYYAMSGLTGYLLLYFLCALLLVIRVNLGHYEAWWRAANIRYAPDIHFDFLREGFVFSVLVIAIAWVLPSVHGSQWIEELMQPLTQPWQNVREEWQRLFTSLNYPAVPVTASFSKTLTLSGHRNVGDAVIMNVQAEDAAQRYWRGIAYDTYTGRGWKNTDEDRAIFTPTRPPELPGYIMRKPVTQTVTVFVPEGDMLFAAPLPAGASIPVRAEVSLLPAESRGPGTLPPEAEAQSVRPVDISMMISRKPLYQGDGYTTRSFITMADVDSLRKAGDAYPPYIKARYLPLPDALPERVRELATEITIAYDSAYDKAAALEWYLRQIKYDDHISPPPPDVDGVDYFLFDVRAGYCDYYASAMAVMARAVGIPARVVSGYAQGKWVEELQAYRVRELDAHTWVEIYFPRYGWIEFEPTASQPLIERPEPPPPTPEPTGPSPDDQFDRGPSEDDPRLLPEEGAGLLGFASSVNQASPWISIALAAMVLLIAVVAGGWWRRRSLTHGSRLTDRLYDRLLRWSTRLGIGFSPARTPYEQATAIATVVPEGQPHVLRIVEAYVRDRFSLWPLRQPEEREVLQSWGRLRPSLWKRWLRRRLGK